MLGYGDDLQLDEPQRPGQSPTVQNARPSAITPRRRGSPDRDRARGDQEDRAGLDDRVEHGRHARRDRDRTQRRTPRAQQARRTGRRRRNGEPSLHGRPIGGAGPVIVQAMATGAEVIVYESRRQEWRSASACPGCTTSRSGRRCGSPRSGSSASATSRPPPMRPTATRARPGGSALRSRPPGRARRTRSARSARRGRRARRSWSSPPTSPRRCAAPASTAASCTRPTARRRCSRRWSSPCTSGWTPRTSGGGRRGGGAAPPAHPAVYLESRPTCCAPRFPGRPGACERAAIGDAGPRPAVAVLTRPGGRSSGPAAARATPARPSAGWPSDSARPSSPPTARRAAAAGHPWLSACRRTSRPPGGCGTRPTS